jgi:hypothetical protein
MKKFIQQSTIYFLSISLMLGISGCQEENPEPNQPQTNPSGSVLTKWSIVINGQTHSWQGNFPESSNTNSGGSTYTQSGGNGTLTFAKNPSQAMFTSGISKIGMITAGTYTINVNNYDATQSAFYINDLTNSALLSIAYGGSINVTVQTFPNQTASTNISSNTLVKGSFSGTIGDANGTLYTVSGSFESIRTN